MTITLPTQIPDDPRGWLTFVAPLPDALQRAEDATQYSDRYIVHASTFTRAATPTERTLLATLGYAVPTDLNTSVHWIGPLRQRRWPQLEQENLSA